VAEKGMEVVLSEHVIDHVVLNTSMRSSLLHQLRWMKSTRCSRPLGHIGSGMTFGVPFGVIWLIAGALGGHIGLGVAILAASIGGRILQALVVGWGVARDRQSLRYCWLYPVRDLFGFALWAWSFMGSRTIVWRGEKYRLLTGGQMVREGMPTLVQPRRVSSQPEHVEVSR
jgi:ceramide glucosyltransferase